MIRNDAKESVFEVLLTRERNKVIGWLKQKYERFPITECEDIFQEGSIELWGKFKSAVDMTEHEFDKLLFTICRNLSSHHLRKSHDNVEWQDSYYPEEVQVETDYGFIGPGMARILMKERMYEEIGRLNAKDQHFMQLHLQGLSFKEIAKRVELKGEQTSRNKKSKLVVRLRNAINGQATACPSFFYLVPCSFSFISFDVQKIMSTFARVFGFGSKS